MRETKQADTKKPKAIIVGGSIAGLSCAHAIILAGWDVLVIEKSSSPPKGSPTGAGVGIDSLSRSLIESWISQPELLQRASIPFTIDQNQAICEAKFSRVLTRDETLNSSILHWVDLHDLLYSALPSDLVLWGHQYLSLSISEDKTSVSVKAKILQTDEIVEINGDLLVAADGCLSSIRKTFLPELKLRYSGYCAWRGVLDFSENENSETILGIRKVYPDLGKCVYMDLSSGTHSILCELSKKRLNWLWYVVHPEPEMKGNSLTMKVTSEMINEMYKEAEKVWLPEFVRVMKDTKGPFINFIYDCDPLEQIFWDNVVLIGDAAHPVTPNGARSTNMSILDAAVLGKCLEKCGAENLSQALKEYQSIRQPVTSAQVIHSRKMGRIKQGLSVPDCMPFDPNAASAENCEYLAMKNMPFFATLNKNFSDIPLHLLYTDQI